MVRAPEATATILVVEDDPSVLQLIVEVLDDEGLRSIGRADIASAIQSLDSDPPDAAVIDYRLPDGVGTDLCDMLRALSVPCFILSAYPRPLGSNVPAQPWMQKPFAVPDLVNAVRSLLAT